MATIEDVFLQRWNAAKKIAKNIPYAHDHAIPRYWRAHPEIGSPLYPEVDLDDGTKAQSFSGGILKYIPPDEVVEVLE